MRRGTLVLLVLATLSAGSLAAQETPPDLDRPVQDTVPGDSLAPDTIVRLPRPTLGYDPARAAFELAFGLPGEGEAQGQPIRLLRTDLSGAVLDSTSLTRTLSIRGGVYGAVAGILGLGRDWALRLGLGVATARVEADYQGVEEDSSLVAAARAVPGTRADLGLLTLEAGVRYRIPSSKRIQPYLEFGTAISRWTVDGSLPAALSDDFGTRIEAIAGVGGVIPLTRRFSARVHASSRVFRTLVGPRVSGDTLGTHLASGWPRYRKDRSRRTILVADPPTRTAFADGARELLGLVRLQLGLSYDFRPPPMAPPAPEAAPDTTSPPGR